MNVEIISKKDIQKILKDENKIIKFKEEDYYTYEAKYENGKYYRCTKFMSGYKPTTLSNLYNSINSNTCEWHKVLDKYEN